MIISIRHKGLQLFYEKGNPFKLQPKHVKRIRKILSYLETATTPQDMDILGYGLHKLSGEWEMFWAVKVDKNYRIIFRFVGKNACDVNYIDYH